MCRGFAQSIGRGACLRKQAERALSCLAAFRKTLDDAAGTPKGPGNIETHGEHPVLFPPDGIGCTQQPTTSHTTTWVSHIELGLCMPCTIKLLICRILHTIHDPLFRSTCHRC